VIEDGISGNEKWAPSRNSSILLQPIAGVRKTPEFETMKKPDANIPLRKADSCPWCGNPNLLACLRRFL
jgi:hypothetical protein